MKMKKVTLFAMAVVALMLATPFATASDGDESDVVRDWNYAYKVTYTDTSSNLTVQNLLSSSSNVSSWSWNTTTGFGPFNMFYAAISTGVTDSNALSSKAGHVAYILNPHNLTQAVKWNGTGTKDISSVMSNYNIMLVIPTVYWGVSDHAFYLTNVPTNPAVSSISFKAYAHQVDNGTIYPYLAIGVYEAKTVSGKGLMSQTGVAPQVSKTLDGFRADVATANNLVTDNVGTYQMWNFYEWTLYKLLAETYIFSFDSQAKAGGNVSGSASSTTGLGNTAGPVSASSTTSYGKILIENSWGSVEEYVDNTYVASGILKAGSGLTPVLSSSNVSIVGADYTGGTLKILTSGNYGRQIATFSQAAATFGVPLTIRSDESAGTVIPDGCWYGNFADDVLVVGGNWDHDASAGFSAWLSNNDLSHSYTFLGARLAYLMTADAVGIKQVTLHYGGGTPDETIAVNVSGGSYTLGTPTLAGYTFHGWFTENNKFTTAKKITEITSTMSDPINVYAAFSKVNMSATSSTYNNSSVACISSVVTPDRTLTSGTDYKVTVYTSQTDYNNGTNPKSYPSAIKDAGTYYIKIDGISNYECIDRQVTFTMNKADYNMSGVTFANSTVTYDGKSHTITASGLPTGLDGKAVTVSYSASGGVTATNVADTPKVITATFATTSSNYKVPAAKTATLTINQANNQWTTIPDIQDRILATQPYDFEEGAAAFGSKEFSFLSTDGGTYSGSVPPTEPGEYTFTATVPETTNYTGLVFTEPFVILAYGPFAIGFDISEHGTISARTTSQPVTDSIIILDIQPDDQYELTSLQIFKSDDETVTVPVGEGTFVMPPYPVTIRGVFSEIIYGVSIPDTIENGTVTASPEGATYGSDHARYNAGRRLQARSAHGQRTGRHRAGGQRTIHIHDHRGYRNRCGVRGGRTYGLHRRHRGGGPLSVLRGCSQQRQILQPVLSRKGHQRGHLPFGLG